MSEINLSDLPKTEIVDVHIASPGARVAAYLLNNLFIFLIWLPFIVMLAVVAALFAIARIVIGRRYVETLRAV